MDDTPSSAESQFADANHPKIVSGITGRLLPNGGAMQLRLDPPELGAMQIKVEMRDGVMTASFETSNDQATRLLSHSLGDLRSGRTTVIFTTSPLLLARAGKVVLLDGGSLVSGTHTTLMAGDARYRSAVTRGDD